MIANRSFSSLIRHIEGVGALLKARGVENIRTSTSRRTFYEYRAIKLPVDLATRRASFLSSSKWINPPWKASELHSVTHLQTVANIAFRLPVLMEKLDQTRQLFQLKGSGDSSNSEILHSLINEGLSIQSALDKWAFRLDEGDSNSPFYISRPASTIESPTIDDIPKLYAISFNFPNWDNASSFVYHSMSQIYVNSWLIDFERETQHFPSAQTEPNPPRINTRELTRKSIECADLICQSIEYFFEDNKRLIGRMVVLAPFEAARSLFSHLCKSGIGDERLNGSLVEKARFCDTVTQRIRESGLPIWDG